MCTINGMTFCVPPCISSIFAKSSLLQNATCFYWTQKSQLATHTAFWTVQPFEYLHADSPSYQLPEHVYTLAKSDSVPSAFKFGYVSIVQLTNCVQYPWFLWKKVTQSLILKFTAFSTADRRSPIHGTTAKQRHTRCRVGHLIISFGAT